MSESTRRVCGEGLSSQLLDREAGVIGKSISMNPYTAVKIGSVGERLSQKMNDMLQRYERPQPKALQRMSVSSRFQNMFRFGSPDLTYLLWSPDAMEEEQEEEVAPLNPWFQSKRSYVGAKTYRMPSSLRRSASQSSSSCICVTSIRSVATP